MSKRITRNSVGPSNTRFNHLTKTRSANKKPKTADTGDGTPDLDSLKKKIEVKIESKKRERRVIPSPEVKKEEHSDDEEPIAPKKRKRIRLPLDSDDSDTENKDNIIETPKEKTALRKKLNDSFKYETNQSPKVVSKGSKKPAATNGPALSAKTETADELPVSDDGNWMHCKLDWLRPDKVRDAHKRKPDHPDYDASTLFVPPDFMNNQTPAQRQWWQMKSSHYDCVLFFKVGQFYELYHMDAAVGVNELEFSYMKGDFAQSGFRESAYATMANRLVSKGYKVARVEQTETPEMMQDRCKKLGKTSKFDKVVRREICQVTLRGAHAAGLQDPGPAEPGADYMLCVTEEESNGISTYGVCFVDASIGLFHLGQFKDDKHSSRLLTTLAHFPPALIVYDRRTTTARTSKLLGTHCHRARREPQTLWQPEKTLKTLAENYYKTNVDGDWPEGLKPFLHKGDALGLTPAPNCYLAIKALGGCVSYLSQCLLDIQVLGMSQFESFTPPDVLNKTLPQEDKVENKWEGGSTMVLDAITLRNLRIVQDEGCLYDKLNFCATAMGKRLLYKWVCAPSCNLAVIKERQEAVKEFFENIELSQDAKNILTTLPDLERLLAKVHTLGNLKRSTSHPDARAILYGEKSYSKRKILDFIAVLNGFQSALKLVELFDDAERGLLRKLTKFSPKGKFPDYRDTLKFFKEGFNQSEAEKEGNILPGAGVDREYDNTLQLIDDIQKELNEYLAEQEKYFKCRLKYVGMGKTRFQIEVPDSATKKATSDYHMEGVRKGFKRFSTSETKDLLARMTAAEEQKRDVLKDLSRRMFEKFSSNHAYWEAAVQCVSVLDILLALAEFARQQSGDVCLPSVTFGPEQTEKKLLKGLGRRKFQKSSSNQAKPFINIVDGRHPCIPVAEFIPNDTSLGGDAALLLLTGPNMGGKSTLMRQLGLLTVLAHLGSYVPASECTLSLVDRVFTRLGAADDILSGQSTFLVEMNETAAIVKHASVHSLVLLDELGRGTSTYDGTAIASGVCVELAERGCRVVFSTHYHSLVHHLGSHPGVVLGHMACMVETDESTVDSDDNPEESITFLYKLSPGACPKSYGFNAARLAGIPKDITRRAHQISKNLEKEATCVRAFRDILKMSDGQKIRELLAALPI